MTSSRTLAAGFALIGCSLVLAVPGVARAQRSAQDIETARQLYTQGFELRDKGDLKGALEKFRAAHALGNTPLTGIELCRTYAALRQPVEAREVCLGVGRIPPLSQETQRSRDARAEAGRIAEAEKPKIGALRLKVVGVPPDREALVLVDGTAIPGAALTEPRAVNPGAHVVTAKVGTGPETRVDVETHEGETRDVELKVVPGPEEPPAGAATATAPASRPAPAETHERNRTLATSLFVVAGVGLVVGTIAGVKASSDESDLEKACINKKCGTELHDQL
jgi:hypothetical protein